MSSHSKPPAIALPLGFVGFGVMIVAIVYELMGWTFLQTPTEITTPTANKTYYSVKQVTDGDTLSVTIDGNEERVRLIGINTPETGAGSTSEQCFGEEASQRMKNLAQGKQVALEYDESQGIRDTYGRLLAYVYLEDGQMLNRKMIADGYAYEYTYMTPYAYRSEFRELQNIAKLSGRGLWGETTCKGTR